MAHWPMLPPSQRQQSIQPPVQAHLQHAFSMGVPVVQHAVGHQVVMPLQVTCPGSQIEQSRFANVQVPPAPGTEQFTVPEAQVAVALQDFAILGRLAANSTSFCGAGQEPVAAGSLRIMARASSVRGATLGAWAAQTAETKAKVQTRIAALFILLSSLRARDNASLPITVYSMLPREPRAAGSPVPKETPGGAA
jgi:hypothetical protein